MSLDNELEDARRIVQYVEQLPFVNKIGIYGHSQGGLIFTAQFRTRQEQNQGSSNASSRGYHSR